MKKRYTKLLTLLTAIALLVMSVPAPAMAAVPAAPSNLLALTMNAGRVDLHWTDNSADETGFLIQRAPDVGGLEPGTYAQIGTVGAGVTTYSDTTVAAVRAYWYRVAAQNLDGTSFYSNQVRIITPRSAPVIGLVTPTPPVAGFQSGASNNLQATTLDPGATVTTAEYQLVLDNAPGVFEAHDIYNATWDLTILASRAAAPVNDITPMPAGLPAGTIAEFEIRGTVAAVDAGEGEWQIGTTPFMVYESVTSDPLSTKFIGSRMPGVGDEVKIVAYRTVADGPLVSKSIRYMAPNQPVVAPTVILSFLYQGALASIEDPVMDTGYLLSGEIWNVGAGSFRVDAPDFPAYIDASIGIGTPVTVRFAEPAAPANVARQIFRQITKSVQITTDPNPIFDTTPVPLDVPAGTWLYVIVDGVVTDLDLVTGTWTIGDEQVKVYQSAFTLVEPATVGDEILAYCRRTITPGPLVAEQINNILPGRLITPVKGTAIEMHLMYNGNIQSMGTNSWTVGGQTFAIDDPEGKARLDPMPYASFAVGDPVTVEFEHLGATVPDNGNWAPLAMDTATWDGNVVLPAISSDTEGTLFLRVTDSIQSSSTKSYPLLLQVPPAGAPAAPDSLNAIVFSGTQVDLDWADNSDNENGFIIERAPDVGSNPGAFAEITSTGPNVTSYSDMTVDANNTYHYRVIAFNTAGNSAASNVAMVTTAPPPTQLDFITPVRTVNVDIASPDITIQTQDPTGAPANVTSDTVINLSSTSGTGQFDGGIATVTILSGTNTATFNYTDNTSGIFDIDVSDGSLIPAQQSIIVVPAGAPSSLSFTSVPQTIEANVVSGAITVQTQDSTGAPANLSAATTVNIITDTTTGRFDVSSGGAFTATSLNIILGSGENTATFYYRDSAAGNPTITASSTGLNGATQTETINAAAANHLVFQTQPGGAQAGLPFTTQPVIAITDDLNNVVTTANDNVTLAITTGTGNSGAVLFGTTTLAAVNGIVTFTDLSIDLNGNNYQLDATADGLTTATSNPFNVSSAPTTADIQLWSGWNLISMPIIPEDTSRAAVLAGIVGNMISIWGYDASTDTWSSWSPIPGVGGDLTTIRDGKGYWLNMSAADTLTVTGYAMPAPPQSPPSYPVVTGWNLIGLKETAATPVDTYLTGNDYRFPIYTFNNGSWVSITTGTTELIPGLGFWAYFNAPGVITP